MTPDAENWIAHLALIRHPEGGWYRETYRAAEKIPLAGLPDRFGAERSFATAIHFLLAGDDFSALHRLKSDEVWHFHAGSALTVHIIGPEGGYTPRRLGPDPRQGESLQAVVPAGCWFGAAVEDPASFALVGCTVAPGFDFADFELGKRGDLLRAFPQHSAIIRRLTRG